MSNILACIEESPKVPKIPEVTPWGRMLGTVMMIVPVCFSLFHLVTAYVGPLSGMRQRIVHLGFSLALTFLVYRSEKKGLRRIIDPLLLLGGVISCLYLFIEDPRLPFRAGITTRSDVIFGIILLVTLLEASRRVIGLALPLVSILFLVYAYLGPYMPGLLQHRGYDLARIVSLVCLSTEGIFGVALGVSATFIILFCILSGFLFESGTAQLFTDMASSIFGRVRGGPAKIATVASCFFGTLSGSAVANVTSTGTFTIPMMIKTGFSPEFAGAVEAVASTGGQFMPPIMASVAFVIAEVLGISYFEVCKVGLIPALLYYLSLFIAVDLRAAKRGLKGLSPDQLPKFAPTFLRSGHMLVPILLLIYLLGVARLSITTSAFWAVVASFAVSFVKKDTRLDAARIWSALRRGAEGVLPVAIACANVGVIVGTLMLTGLGFRLSGILVELCKESIPLLLVSSMVVCILLGMGVPTLAVYLVVSIFVAPVLINHGVLPVAVHMFVFYFGVLSCITPPVAVAAYTAAGISGASPMSTGFTAFRLALPSFIIPFMFVYNPALLMMGDPLNILWSFTTSLIGVGFMAAGLEGYLLRQTSVVERGLLIASGLCLIWPGLISDVIGLAVGVSVYLHEYWARQGTISASRIDV